ncbi:MAG TPA: type IV toxin-antitoxin system AbiEi family antitoxin domain-containing protein, partial [Fibrobacteria bacterium]|nr:type IV toxin-antitoxin system AbiEi family antitoxin domain-containing protein [Fibrobacteria bacterium]
RLYEVAAVQEGLFTARQAIEAGYSLPLLVHHRRAGNIARLRRGIYRLVQFPASEHEELVAIWLWSEQQGVVSHQNALLLHELSDVLPSQIHLTLPAAWRPRRLRVPEGVVVYHADVSPDERTWFGAVPITTPRRTLMDCARDGIDPKLLRQAVKQALARGHLSKRQLEELDRVPALGEEIAP